MFGWPEKGNATRSIALGTRHTAPELKADATELPPASVEGGAKSQPMTKSVAGLIDKGFHCAAARVPGCTQGAYLSWQRRGGDGVHLARRAEKMNGLGGFRCNDVARTEEGLRTKDRLLGVEDKRPRGSFRGYNGCPVAVANGCR